VAKTSVVLLLVILASALATSQALDPVPGESGPDLKAAYSGSALTCTQPPPTSSFPDRPWSGQNSRLDLRICCGKVSTPMRKES